MELMDSPWNLGWPVTFFDQYNAVEVMLCPFWIWMLRVLAAHAFAVLEISADKAAKKSKISYSILQKEATRIGPG